MPIAALLAVVPFVAGAGIPMPPARPAPPPQQQTTQQQTPTQQKTPTQPTPPAETRTRIDVSPQATGQSRLAPAGTTNGTSTPLSNATGNLPNAPTSPTPPGFPFGLPGGSYAPGG